MRKPESRVFLCNSISFMGTRIGRTYEWINQAILSQIHELQNSGGRGLPEDYEFDQP
jgi:hypothetical protein